MRSQKKKWCFLTKGICVLFLLPVLEPRLLELPRDKVRGRESSGVERWSQGGGVNVTDLIFAKTEDAYRDLFPIKPNHARMQARVGMFLRTHFQHPTERFLEKSYFLLESVPGCDWILWESCRWQVGSRKGGHSLSFLESQTYLGIFNSSARQLVGSSLKLLLERADGKGWGRLQSRGNTWSKKLEESKVLGILLPTRLCRWTRKLK